MGTASTEERNEFVTAIDKLVLLRESLRQKKDFESADKIREVLFDWHIQIEDGSTPPRWFFYR